MRLAMAVLALLAPVASGRGETLAVYESEHNAESYHGVYQAPLREWLDDEGEAFEAIGDTLAADAAGLARFPVVLASSAYLVPEEAAAGLCEYVRGGGRLLWIDSPARTESPVLRQTLGLGPGIGYMQLGATTLAAAREAAGLYGLEALGLEAFVGNPATAAASDGTLLYTATGVDAAGAMVALPAVTCGRLGAGAGICVNWIPWGNREPGVGHLLRDALDHLLAFREGELPPLVAVARPAAAHLAQPAPLDIEVRLVRTRPGATPDPTYRVSIAAEGGRRVTRAGTFLQWQRFADGRAVATGRVGLMTAGLPDGAYTVSATVECGGERLPCRPAQVTLEGEAVSRQKELAQARRTLLAPRLAGTLGDYDSEPRTPEGRVDIPRLLEQIRGAHMSMYDWLIWHAPTDLEDLKLFLPLAREAGVRVWATLCPPSESGNTMPYSEPHRTDYLAWARELGALAKEYDNLDAVVIDDFWTPSNQSLFTAEYIGEMVRTLRSYREDLAFLPTVYIGTIGDEAFLRGFGPHIDGIVFPYGDLEAAGPLREQLARCRDWLGPDRFLMVNVYASGSDGRSEPGDRSAEYLRETLATSREAADGIRIYCLPKEQMLEDYRYAIVAELYAEWRGAGH